QSPGARQVWPMVPKPASLPPMPTRTRSESVAGCVLSSETSWSTCVPGSPAWLAARVRLGDDVVGPGSGAGEEDQMLEPVLVEHEPRRVGRGSPPTLVTVGL